MMDTIFEIFREIFEEFLNFITFEYSWWMYVVVLFVILMYFSVKKEYRNAEIQKQQHRTNSPEIRADKKTIDDGKADSSES